MREKIIRYLELRERDDADREELFTLDEEIAKALPDLQIKDGTVRGGSDGNTLFDSTLFYHVVGNSIQFSNGRVLELREKYKTGKLRFILRTFDLRNFEPKKQLEQATKMLRKRNPVQDDPTQ